MVSTSLNIFYWILPEDSFIVPVEEGSGGAPIGAQQSLKTTKQKTKDVAIFNSIKFSLSPVVHDRRKIKSKQAHNKISFYPHRHRKYPTDCAKFLPTKQKTMPKRLPT